MKKEIDFYRGYIIKEDNKGYFYLYMKHLPLCKSKYIKKLYDLVDEGYRKAKEKARKNNNWHTLVDLVDYDEEIKKECTDDE